MSDITMIPAAEFRLEAVPAGTSQRLHLHVAYSADGSPLLLPLLCVRGIKPGPTLVATGAVHGDEFEGPLAIQKVFAELDPAQMSGAFVGLPVVNPPALAAGTRESGADHLNLARIFPGSATGLPSERIAAALTRLFGLADLLLDIHSAGNAFKIKEFAGYVLGNGDLAKMQRQAAIAFGLDLVWGTAPLPGRSLSAARDQGVPAIYVEMQGEGRAPADRLRRTEQGVRQVLGYLGITSDYFPDQQPEFFKETAAEGSGHLQVQLLAPESGLFVAEVEVWKPVTAGQQLGVLRHLDGRQLAAITAPVSGRVLFIRTFPRVQCGETLGFVLDQQ